MMLQGKLCSPIRQMLDGDEYGSVIFHTSGYKQTSGTRIAVLNLRKRYNYDYRTKMLGDDKLMVVRAGGDGLPAMEVDIREEW